MSDNIDNLLDDLDALITNKPPPVNCSSKNTSSGDTLPYRIPHRPPNEKSPTQINNPNPKNKFAITPSYNQQQQQQQGFRSENTRQSNHRMSSASASASNSNSDDIDALLDLLDDSPTQSSSSFQSSHNNNSSYSTSKQQTNSTSSYTPQYQSLSSQSSNANGGYVPSSTSSSSFPSFERGTYSGTGTGGTSVHAPATSRHDSKHHSASTSGSSTAVGVSDINSFDSLLSDLNSSLPPVSPNTKQKLDESSSSSSATLLQPPPQSTGGATKGGRCSRVVVAGSAMSRGAKTSAFSKSACDRLRCLKCNFEAIQFPGSVWTSAVDYMFFRNNMPNRQKLSPQLEAHPASVAYCCQCSWLSTEDEQTLSAGQPDKPQWVCAGH